MPLAALLGVQTVEAGHADAVSRVLHRGRTLIAVDTEVRDSGGRLVAGTSQAQRVLSPRGPRAV
jgi:acyl-coenzyme A thioesterase PaaI-like protein